MATHYVDNRLATGANTGTSEENAWQSIGDINSVSINVGDTIEFVAGSGPYREPFDTQKNGTLADPIIWSGNGVEVSAGRDMNAAAYKWTASGAGTNEYYLEAAAGGNPSLVAILALAIDGHSWITSAGDADHQLGTPGSIAMDLQPGFGDADTLGFNTLYVRVNSGAPAQHEIIAPQSDYSFNINWGHHEIYDFKFSHGNIGVIRASGLNLKFFRCALLYSDFMGFRANAGAAGLGTEHRYELHHCIFYWTGHRAIQNDTNYNEIKAYNCVDWGSHLMVWMSPSVDATCVVEMRNSIAANEEAGAVDIQSATATFTETNNLFYPRMTAPAGAVGYINPANWPTTDATDIPPSITTTETNRANLQDPQFVKVIDDNFDECDFNLLPNSPCLGAGIGIGDFGLITYGGGEITPGFGVDMGAIQSTLSDFHPRQLSGPSIFGGIPNEYRATIYGDSYSDSGGGTGWIGQTLNINTSVDFILREQATGGDLVSEIRTAFEADFPHNRDNLVILQGAINSIRTDVSLGSIQADWIAMADAVLQADNIDLLVVNQSPWFGHAQWTEARQAITEQFNAWLKGKYGHYLANTYVALGDPAEPRQLDDEFYKLARTDSHPSRNGDVVIDDNLGELLYYDVPEITRSAEPGNSHAFPNTPADWNSNLRATIGGNPIRMCDGTYSSVNGIIPSSDSITHIARHSFTAPPNGSSITTKGLIKAGQHQWGRIEYKDNAGALHNAYIDLLNVALGTESGSFTWTVAKAARGWLEVIGVGVSGTGAGANNITFFPAEANGDSNYVGDARTPSIYVDRVQFIVT